MTSKVVVGIVAGLIGGLVFGIMMAMMSAPDGKPMMQMIAMVVRSDSVIVGWLYHLFNSAVIGGLFGLMLGARVAGYGSGLIWGMVWGMVWWILGGLILMPLALGMPMFAPIAMEPMRVMAVMSLMGHLIFGAIMGLAFFLLFARVPARVEAGA